MKIDLTNPFNEGYGRLKTWRDRYDKKEYPFKVVLNTFYRQFTMYLLWESDIETSFTKFSKTEFDVYKSFDKMQDIFSKKSQLFTIGDTLINLMEKKQDVGGLNYANNISLIERAQEGDNSVVEELEFTYLYYDLANITTLWWAALGRVGMSKINAIGYMTNIRFSINKEITYADILSLLGKYVCAETLNNLYQPLPPLF